MPYVPPNGDAVGLEFGGSYLPPNGASVNLEFDPSVGGIRQAGAQDSARFGTPGIYTSKALTHGTDFSVFGRLSIKLDIPIIYPLSIDDSSVVSAPEYVRWPRFLTVDVGVSKPIWPLGDGRVRLLGGYNPPPAINVVLNWLYEPYSTPPAENVVLEFGALGSGRILGATLFNQLGFGTPALSRPLGAQPDGIASTVGFGSHVISLFVNTLRPTGWHLQAFGTPDLVNAAYGVSVGGIAPPPQTGPNHERQLPDPFIDFRTRYLKPVGIGVPANQIVNAHYVASDIQFIDLAGRGPVSWGVGNARFEYATRYIEPPFIASNIFGSHNVAQIQVVALDGWESSFISENHELDINLQRITVPTGEADPAGYGDTHVRNQFEVLWLTGWLSQNINFPLVYNVDQYVFVQPYMGTNDDTTQWPTYSPFVENKIRVLGPIGWRSSRFSVIGNVVENIAVPISPLGLDATLWGPETFIAPYSRYVGPDGWDSFYNTQYTVIFNNAVVIASQSWDSAQVGKPQQVLNLNRTVKHIFPYDGEAVGTAFIAYRVRSIFSGLFYDVPSSFPEVRFNPYPIAPAGIPLWHPGGHTVYEFFATVFPKSANVHSVPWVGEPFIQNRNKTLEVFPSDQSLYGLSKVFNYNTNLTITAGELSAWGSQLISYRTRTFAVASISVPVFSVTHKIRNVLPDPPAQQVVLPYGLYSGGVPSPTIPLTTVYPAGITEERYGHPFVRTNTLEASQGMFNPDLFGVPTLIFTQYLFAKARDSTVIVATPRVTPHTIYAPAATEATAQALSNHYSWPRPHRIDSHLVGYGSLDGGWPWFGLTDVSNQNRTIGPAPKHGFSSPLGPITSYGSPTLTLRLRYVYLMAIRRMRFGLPMFLNVPQYVNLDSMHLGAPPLNAFGGHKVAFPLEEATPEAKPFGFVATLWGQHRVELFNRTVLPQGIPHRGNPQQDLTNPWGTPLVGYPRIYNWGGYILTLWGSTWVSYKDRNLPVEGWNSLSLEDDDLGSFADRMRMRLRNPENGLIGIGSKAVIGNHVVSYSVRTVFGRGFSGYNSGSCIAKAVTATFPAGWDSLEVGDIDRWEAGKVKPYGDDLSIMGAPRLLHPLRPSGLYDDVVDMPRVVVPIRLMGMPEIGFAGPSVTDPFGCTNRVVATLPALSQLYVSQPVVTL